MSDLRKFCIGMFIGLGSGAALQNHGIWNVPTDLDPMSAINTLGLVCGSLAVIWFGERKERQS